VENTINADTSNIIGAYKTGAAASGVYSVRVEKNGYQPQIIPGVSLSSGLVTQLDVALVPALVTSKGPDAWTPLRVSPTLFTDRITVETPVNFQSVVNGATASILNLQGQVVYEARIEGPRADLYLGDALPAGAYLVVLRKQGQIAMAVRIVKNT
jgi:hypothetical protein